MHAPFVKTSTNVLALNDLRLKVYLGVPDAERAELQEISISFRVYYKSLPKACKTDSPYGMTCYFELAESIKGLCDAKEFNTLEYLAYFLYESLKKEMDETIKFRICVEKCNPPVEGVLGTTSFECGDET